MELGTKWAGKQRSLKVGGDFTLKSETLSTNFGKFEPTFTADRQFLKVDIPYILLAIRKLKKKL